MSGDRTRTASVMFIDIVGSTAILDTLGQAVFDELRHRYEDHVDRILDLHQGSLIKGTGDGSLAVFDSASGAIEGAVELQQALSLDEAQLQAQLSIRVGIALGDCSFDGGDVYGVPVVTASRLCDQAGADGILATDLAMAVASPSIEIDADDAQEYELKGFAEPVRAHRVLWKSLGASPLELPNHLRFDGAFPFCGRREELEQLDGVYRATLDGRMRAVALVGEPGIGKTRLLGAAASGFHGLGATVLFGACDENESRTHQPIAEWLDHFVHHRTSKQLADRLGGHVDALTVLSPELAEHLGRVPGSGFEGDRHQLYRAVIEWLSLLAEDGPVVIVVDDLQWATAATVELLSALVRETGDARILLVATMRDTETAPNEPVADLVTQLHRTERYRELRLEGLDSESVEELMSVAAGRRLNDAERTAVDEIARSTNGNVLFVTELVRHLVEVGAIATIDGHLQLAVDPTEVDAPPSIRSIVDQRIRRLGPEVAPAMEAAAVVGARFDPLVVAGALEANVREVDDALDIAIDAHLVVERQPPFLEFSHAIVRQTIYSSLTARRRARLHAAVADVLEGGIDGQVDERVLQIADHLERASERDADRLVRATVRAAGFSTSRLDHAGAAGWYERALEHAIVGGASDDEQIELQIEHGIASKRAGHLGFRESLLNAARRAHGIGDPATQRRALLQTHRGVYASAGRVDAELVQELESALAETPKDDVESRALLGAQLASELTWDPDLDRKTSVATNSEMQAREHGDERLLVEVLICVSDIAEIVEPPPRLIARAQELIALGHRRGDQRAIYFGSLNLATASLAAGRLELAWQAIDGGYEALEYLGEPILETHINPRRASLLIGLGRFEEALEVAQRGYEMRPDTKQPEALMVYASHQFEIFRHQGQLGVVEELLEATAAENPEMPIYLGGLCLIYCATGQLARAQQQWETLSANGIAPLMAGMQNVALHAAVYSEVAFELQDETAAAELLPIAESRRDEIAYTGPAFRAPVLNTLGQLHAILGDHDAAMENFEGAIAKCEEIGMEPESVHCRMHFVKYLDRCGLPERADQVAEDAVPIATRLGMEGALRIVADRKEQAKTEQAGRAS